MIHVQRSGICVISRTVNIPLDTGSEGKRCSRSRSKASRSEKLERQKGEESSKHGTLKNDKTGRSSREVRMWQRQSRSRERPAVVTEKSVNVECASASACKPALAEPTLQAAARAAAVRQKCASNPKASLCLLVCERRNTTQVASWAAGENESHLTIGGSGQ